MRFVCVCLCQNINYSILERTRPWLRFPSTPNMYPYLHRDTHFAQHQHTHSIQAASSSCAWRTLVLLADCDRRGGEPNRTAGIPARPFGWSGHGDGTLEPLSAMRVATSSGRSAEFGTAPGPHGSDRPASVAVQGELDVGAGGVVSELGEVSGSVSASGEVGLMGT